MAAIFKGKGIDLARPIITTCGPGVTAAVVSLALELAGASRVTLYDGSWAEYAAYLQAHDLARLLDYLGQHRATYGECLSFYLAAALFYTCARFSEMAHLRWHDCLLDASGRPVALRIRGKGGHHQNLPVNAALSELLTKWRTIQEQHRGMKVFAARGLKFCRSDFVFYGPGGDPYTNKSFNRHLGAACKDLGLSPVLTAHGLRHSGATILLNDQGKNLREVQEALRHRDIRTTAATPTSPSSGGTLGFPSVAEWDRANARGCRFALGGGLRLEIFDNAREARPLPLGTVADRVHVVVEVADVEAFCSQRSVVSAKPQTTSWRARVLALRDPDGAPVTILQWLDARA